MAFSAFCDGSKHVTVHESEHVSEDVNKRNDQVQQYPYRFLSSPCKNKDWMILTIGAKVNKVNCQYYFKKMGPIIYLYYPFDVPH